MNDAKLTVDIIAELQNEIATQREVICNLNAMNDELQAKLDKIEQIVNEPRIFADEYFRVAREIKEILEQE